jgi:hypothetical protein
VLIKVLLAWKDNGPSELPATQYPPILVYPTQTFVQILSDLLGGHYPILKRFVNVILSLHLSPPQNPAEEPGNGDPEGNIMWNLENSEPDLFMSNP